MRELDDRGGIRLDVDELDMNKCIYHITVVRVAESCQSLHQEYP